MNPGGIKVLKLRKIKRPGGIFVYDVQPVLEDDFGVWLYAARGSNWETPHDKGTLPCDALLLLSPERHWVAWWVDDPDDKRLEIDVCLAPELEHDGWSYVDLELDPIRHEGGMIEIEDHEEFDNACRMDGFDRRKRGWRMKQHWPWRPRCVIAKSPLGTRDGADWLSYVPIDYLKWNDFKLIRSVPTCSCVGISEM